MLGGRCFVAWRYGSSLDEVIQARMSEDKTGRRSRMMAK